jgi:hypothetical protein
MNYMRPQSTIILCVIVIMCSRSIENAFADEIGGGHGVRGIQIHAAVAGEGH